MVYNSRYNTRKASRESSWSQLCPQDFKIKDRIFVDLGKIENRKRDGILNVHTHSAVRGLLSVPSDDIITINCYYGVRDMLSQPRLRNANKVVISILNNVTYFINFWCERHHVLQEVPWACLNVRWYGKLN